MGTVANRDPTLIHPTLLVAWTRVQIVMEVCGHPVFLTEGVRSHARQDELYAQGRTTPGAIVTNAKAGQSDHHPGPDGLSRALDFAFLGPDPWAERHPWRLVGEVARALEILWGGDWSKPDRPHLYLPKRTSAGPVPV